MANDLKRKLTIEELTTGETAWWSGPDEEIFTSGPENSRDDAIWVSGLDGGFVVAQCTTQMIRLSRFFDVDSWFSDLMNGPFDELLNEDGDRSPVEDLSKEDEVVLEKAVRAAIDTWQVDRQLRLKAWIFAKVENLETVTEDERKAACSRVEVAQKARPKKEGGE